MKSCNCIGGNFFYICPIVLTCPPVTITCSGWEKDTKVSTSLWAQLFRKQSHCDVTDSHRTSTYMVLTLTKLWDACLNIHVTYAKQPDHQAARCTQSAYSTNNPYLTSSPFTHHPSWWCKSCFVVTAKLTMKMETAHSSDTRTIQSTSTHHHHRKTGSTTPWDSRDSAQPFHLSNIQTLSIVVSEHVLHEHTNTHTSCTFWSCLITAICTVFITITNSSMWNAQPIRQALEFTAVFLVMVVWTLWRSITYPRHIYNTEQFHAKLCFP